MTTQAVIASEAKQSPSRKEEIASSQKTLLAMTWAEQLPLFEWQARLAWALMAADVTKIVLVVVAVLTALDCQGYSQPFG